MKAIIVEDKLYVRKGLLNFLSLLDTELEVVGECETVKEAVIVTKSCKPDLVFLDINLSDGTGFDYLEQSKPQDFKVIFITAYEEYALRALKIGAVDYLLKPVDIDELRVALDKVLKQSLSEQKQHIKVARQVYNDQGDILILSLQDTFQIIDLEELVFCESDKGYTTFHLNNGKKYLASKPLKEFEEQLLKQSFTRPHQSFIVNLKYIDNYEKSGTIYLKNGQRIPVSSRKKEDFLKYLFNWNKGL